MTLLLLFDIVATVVAKKFGTVVFIVFVPLVIDTTATVAATASFELLLLLLFLPFSYDVG